MESPTRVKSQATVLLSFLKKHSVGLDAEGEPDFTKIEKKAIRELLEANRAVVKVTLLRADLDFEYPHLQEHKKGKDALLASID